VFLARGYDGATTTEMARAADLGAGTFYLHFRDKRAAFEGLAQRVAHTVMARWLAALAPGMRLATGAALALEVTASFWRSHPDQARLLLESGPSFGTAAHLRLVDEFAAALRTRFGADGAGRRAAADARALGALVVGLAIEIGRLVLGSDDGTHRAAVSRMIGLARHAATALERPVAP
jgi:AcrR family transcriptional regulator